MTYSGSFGLYTASCEGKEKSSTALHAYVKAYNGLAEEVFAFNQACTRQS